MKKNTLIAGLLALAMLVSGCAGQMENPETVGSGETSGSASPTGTQTGGEGTLNPDEIFSDRDFEVGYDESESIRITLGVDGATCDSNAVEISGSTVTILEEGTYILSGRLEDGMVIVNTDKKEKVQLVLNDVSIHSETSAPIYVLQSDKVFITLAEGTENVLSGGGTFLLDTADDSLHCNASLTVSGGNFIIASSDDGFHADDTLTVNGGTILITESYEGLEGLHVNITGGDITLTASDDGLNAAGGTDSSGTGGRGNDQFGRPGGIGGMPGGSSGGTITISGGTLHITAYGDGIDANGSLAISGGYTVVCGPTQGDTSTLDYDTTGVITGGTFLGTGASGMAQSFSDSGQGVIAVRVSSAGAGTEITLTDSDGNVILSHTPELSFAVVILSSSELQKGETYSLTVGTISGEVEAD